MPFRQDMPRKPSASTGCWLPSSSSGMHRGTRGHSSSAPHSSPSWSERHASTWASTGSRMSSGAMRSGSPGWSSWSSRVCSLGPAGERRIDSGGGHLRFLDLEHEIRESFVVELDDDRSIGIVHVPERVLPVEEHERPRHHNVGHVGARHVHPQEAAPPTAHIGRAHGGALHVRQRNGQLTLERQHLVTALNVGNQAIILELDSGHSSPTLIRSLPRCSPLNNLFIVSGKPSSPSTMCSRDLSAPSASQPASACVASSLRAA